MDVRNTGVDKKRQVNLGMVARRAVMLFLPAVILLSSILAVFYYTNVRAERRIIESIGPKAVDLQQKTITRNFQSIVSDVMVLAQHEGLERIFDGNKEAKVELADELFTFSERKRCYDQIRYLDESGMELVRVNFNEGKPSRVPEGKLQNKGDRYYFADAFLLDKDELFVSPLDLNVENGMIERPLKENIHLDNAIFDSIWREAKDGKHVKPMVRFATPVFSSSGEKKGIVLANYFGAQLINVFDEMSLNTSCHCFLVNREGFWLKGPSCKNEWGFMREHDEDQTFGNTFGEAWERISREESGQFYTSEGLFTFTTVYPLIEALKTSVGSEQVFDGSVDRLKAREYYWKIISHMPPSVLFAKSKPLAVWVLGIGGMLTIILGSGSWFLACNSVAKRQAEEELRQNQERFRVSILEAPFPIMIHAEDGEVLQINKVWTELTGYEPDEIPTLSAWTERAYGKRMDVVESRIDKIFDCDTKVHEGEYTIRSNDGKELIWDFSSAPLGSLPDGRRLVISMSVDVTGRKQSEKILTAANQQLDASNQQLTASEQHLKAANQQLDASNQQLRANDQQLRAANQQLRANDQQLRAANQQLRANQIAIESLAKFPSENTNPVLRISDEGTILYANEASSVVLDTWGCREGEQTPEPCLSRFKEAFHSGKISDFEFACNNGHLFLVTLAPIVTSGYINAYGLDITGRKETERALRETEEYFRDFFENAAIANHSFGPDKIIIDINNAELEMIGYTKDEIVGKKTWADLIIPEQKAQFEKHWQNMVTKGGVRELEYTLVHKDGHYVDVLLNASSRFDENGNLICTRGTALNITARKQAAEALLQSEERFRQLAENISEVFWITSPDYKEMIYVSPAYEMIWGQSCESLYANPENWLNAIVEEDRGRIISSLGKSLTEGVDQEYRILRPDNSIRWIRDRGFPVRDKNGDIYRMVGIAEDITERIQAEEELGQVNQQLQSSIEQMPTAYILWDTDFRVLEWNEAAEEIFGYTRDEVLGSQIYELIVPKHIHHIVRDVFEKLRNGESFNYSKPSNNVRKDGAVISCQWHNKPLVDNSGNIFAILSIAEDITDRLRAEEQEKQHQMELAHVSRLNLIGQMTSELAHELNQPLCAVLTNAEGALRAAKLSGSKDDEILTSRIEAVVKQADRAGKIIGRVRDFARKGKRTHSEVDLNAAIKEVLEMVDGKVEKGNIRVVLNLQDDIAMVQADMIQIEQVILNLVQNGMDALHADGVSERVLTISTRHIEARIEVSVRDSGAGIGKGDIVKVFEPFFTTKSEGLGMGLSICRSIIEAHKGRLWMENNPDGGAAAIFRLP